MACKHENFHATVDVSRLERECPMRYMADVRIACMDCGVPMRFIGLPGGLDLNGAATSADATEGRFAIAPKGEVIPPLSPDSVHGFSIRSLEPDKC